MNAHALKIWPPYFDHIMSGEKTFDVRLNDRNYQRGDKILFREWSPEKEDYTGRECVMRIDYILRSSFAYPPTAGLQPGYCVLGLMMTATQE